MNNFEQNKKVSKEEVINKSFDNLPIAKRALSNLLELDVKVEGEEKENLEELKDKIEEILAK